MEIINGQYCLLFPDGGLEIRKGDERLYYNKKPVSVTVKTHSAISVEYDGPYQKIEEEKEGIIVASGLLELPTGTVFQFEDIYSESMSGIRVKRKVKVCKAGKDRGFSSKFSMKFCGSKNPYDYEYFAPGAWYRHNQFAPDTLIGKDLKNEYFWQLETKFALPVFAAQATVSGETIAFSRWTSDVGMRNLEIEQSENNVDELFTIGSIGISKPSNMTLNYMYYGFAVRTPNGVSGGDLSMDYIYPGAEGQIPKERTYAGLDFKNKPMDFKRINHPVQDGFEQNYSVVITLLQSDTYQGMIRKIWRTTYQRMRDKFFQVNNEKCYHDFMKIFMRYTEQYGEVYGLPFACQLPDMDVSSVSFQFGFVGQQPGIGNLLLRYGKQYQNPEAVEKGEKILNFWTQKAQSKSGLPEMCYNPNLGEFEPYPHYLRMMADGVEAVQDAYVWLLQNGEEHKEWLEFCRGAADWLINVQNADGSYYRAYEADGSVRMNSKSNTPSIIRFLVQMYLITGEEKYRRCAEHAGIWSLENLCPTLEYRGGTCDSADIQDKEAGIYALFGFLALYDLTEEERWLQAAQWAADYTETWTYAWKFPIAVPWKKHPFQKYSISGQSIITISGGADVYMAACAYVYYRLYLLTEDEHYLDFALFIYKNTRQSNDVDGSIGYAMPGLGHESGSFESQKFQSQYHWLPWCTFVEAEPSSRFYDTFGYYEIEEIEKMPWDERKRRNRIYDFYGNRRKQ